MSPSLVTVLLAVTVASVAAGCGEDPVGAGTRTGDDDGVRIACTAVGCTGAATLDLRGVPPTARSVRACVEGRCEIVDRRRATMIRIPLPQEDVSGGPWVRRASAVAVARGTDGSPAARGTAVRRRARPSAPAAGE